MEKKLRINTNPLIRVYQYNAYVNEILTIDNECLPWLVNNYIQLVFYKDYIGEKFTFDFFTGNVFGGIPLIEYKTFEEKDILIKSESSTHEFVRECIDNGFYIYTFLNEFYVPNRQAYNKFDYVHDILIYGYDIDDKKYNVIGYNDNMQYKESEIHFNMFYRAFCNEEHCVILYKKAENKEYKFNIVTAYEMLNDYVDSIDSSIKLNIYHDLNAVSKCHKDYLGDRLGCNQLYGLAIYDGIILLCKHSVNNRDEVDIRTFYGNYEHKLCMLLRLAYLEDDKYLGASNNIKILYTSIAEEAKLITNLILKYNTTRDINILVRVIAKLDSLKVNEEKAVRELIHELE